MAIVPHALLLRTPLPVKTSARRSLPRMRIVGTRSPIHSVGTDEASFSIVSTTGQIQTKAALDHETKSSYSVTVTADDDRSGADRITVTINVTDVNEPPVFTEGTSATRSVAENTTSGQNIGNAITATDVDENTLTYTLGGDDASSFGIDSTNGQLQTKAALDYETQTSYSGHRLCH